MAGLTRSLHIAGFCLVCFVLVTVPLSAEPDTVPVDEKLVTTYFFYWYHENPGEMSDHPWLPAGTPLWWRSLPWYTFNLRRMSEAGIDVVLPVYWGFPHSAARYNYWSNEGLELLVQAAQQMAAAGETPPKIGMFYDTVTLTMNPVTYDYDQHRYVRCSYRAVQFLSDSHFVIRCYTVLLNRTPDLFELEEGVLALGWGGITRREFIGGILDSPAYGALIVSDTEFVNDTFELILGREPDSTGYLYWLDFLTGGGSRDAMLQFVDESYEASLNPGLDITAAEPHGFFWRTVRDFFDMVPDELRATVDGRPLIQLYASHFAGNYNQWSIDQLEEQFQLQFGVAPYIVREASWNVDTDSRYQWGAALNGPRLLETAAVGPGYDDSSVRYPPSYRDREGGRYYRQSWEAAIASGVPMIAIETWNEFYEGTDVCDSAEYNDQFINLTRHYSALYKGESSPITTPGLVAGPGPGLTNPPLVRTFPPQQDATHTSEFTAYGAPSHGVNVSCGDVDGNQVDEVLTGAGPGEIYGPHVRGFTVDGVPVPGLNFFAYGTPRYGVNVCAGDIDDDEAWEVITGAGPGRVFGPHVRAFDLVQYGGGGSAAPSPWVNFFAYGTIQWGVNVAAGDIDGDGYDEIVTGAGPGTIFGPHVRGWNVDGGPAEAIPAVSFFAYGTNEYGVNVTCGDVDGDGLDELVTGAGPGAAFGAHVRGWNYDGTAVTELPGFNFFAWLPSQVRYGAKVCATADLDGDWRNEVVVGPGPDPSTGSPVNVYSYDGSRMHLQFSLQAFPADWKYGATVAAGGF